MEAPMATRKTLTCPECNGAGVVTVLDYRGGNTGETSRPEWQEPCDAFGCEAGRITRVRCAECREVEDAPAAPHWCDGTADSYRCEVCVREGLHSAACRAERAEALADGRSDR